MKIHEFSHVILNQKFTTFALLFLNITQLHDKHNITR